MRMRKEEAWVWISSGERNANRERGRGRNLIFFGGHRQEGSAFFFLDTSDFYPTAPSREAGAEADT